MNLVKAGTPIHLPVSGETDQDAIARKSLTLPIIDPPQGDAL
jgi:hypothetical protein